VTVLKPGDAIASPVDGVTLTGIGYVDGRLHVQAYYADILKTDNHGSISLVNRRPVEQIRLVTVLVASSTRRTGEL